ncbi:hypothetical protein ACHFCA_35000 (plasmid) [Delftia tsuruhatensis]
MSNETIAWKICYTDNGQYRTVLSEHNSVGDYRAIDPMASSIALCAAPVSAKPVAYKVPGGTARAMGIERYQDAASFGGDKDRLHAAAKENEWKPLYAAPVAAPVSAEPTDDEIIDMAVEPLGIDCDRMPYGVIVFARTILSRYSAAPVAAQEQPDLIRFDYVNADGQPDSKMITHDEMRERYAVATRHSYGQAQQPVSGADGSKSVVDTLADLLKLAEEYQVKVESEWGAARSLKKIEEDGDLPIEIVNARAALAQQPAGGADVAQAIDAVKQSISLIQAWVEELDEGLYKENCKHRADGLRHVLSWLLKTSFQQDADKVDTERYRAWRDALITGKTAEDDFIRLVADNLPTSVGVSRRPTAAEWDAAIDAARKEPDQ